MKFPLLTILVVSCLSAQGAGLVNGVLSPVPGTGGSGGGSGGGGGAGGGGGSGSGGQGANSSGVLWFSKNGQYFTNVNFYSIFTTQNTNDIFYLGPGTFDLQNNFLVMTNGVQIIGSGKYSTVISGTNQNNPIVGWTENNILANLTVQNTLSNGTFTSVLGPASFYTLLGTTDQMINVAFFGHSDGYHPTTGAGNQGTNTLIVTGCSGHSYWDVWRHSTSGVNDRWITIFNGVDLTSDLATGWDLTNSAGDNSGFYFSASSGINSNIINNLTITIYCGTNPDAGMRAFSVSRATNIVNNVTFNIFTNGLPLAAGETNIFLANCTSFLTNMCNADGSFFNSVKGIGGWATNNIAGTQTIAALTAIQQSEQVQYEGSIFTLGLTAPQASISSNTAPYTIIQSGGLHTIALNKGWTNDLGARADLIINIAVGASSTNLLALTNTQTGECYTNIFMSYSGFSGAGQTANFIDISPGDFGTLSNYGAFSTAPTIVAHWKLR